VIGDGLPVEVPPPGSSFTDLLRTYELTAKWDVPAGAGHLDLPLPEATTVMALRFDAGVVMVGDRQATEGYSVAHRRMQKVFAADDYSAVAISGTAGLAIELVRLFQTELEHYEKLEGIRLSLDGKATYLARMVRSQLPMAMQGLVVIPLFCGVDELTGEGHVFTFDAVGGRYEEHDFGATGSGSREAKSYLRTTYAPDMDAAAAVDIAMQALVAAAEQDVATGGPDIRRGIYPNVVVVTGDGLRDLPTDETAASAERALEVIR